MKSVLYLTPKQLYDTKMSIGRRLYVEAIGKLADLHISGPGWPDWPDDNKMSTWHQNSGIDPDCIVAYKTEQVEGLEAWPVACIFNEANDRKKTMDDLNATKATDVFFHHAGDYAQWLGELSRMGKRCHLIHHCSPRNPFATRKNFLDRPIKIGLCGVLSPEIYPVRDAFAKSGICTVRKHPGYRILDVQAQYEDYQRWLADVQVLICCTSKYKYPLAKIHEGLAAGCIVVSDRPNCPFLTRVDCIEYLSSYDIDAMQLDSAYMSYLERRFLSLPEKREDGLHRSLDAWRSQFLLEYWAENFMTAMFGEEL